MKFVEQMNQLAEANIPFFFLIDFEMEKPIVLPLIQLAKSDISFSLKGKEFGREVTETQFPKPISPKELVFSKYFKKIELAKKHIAYGDSYLLNLTQCTELKETVNLESLYKHADSHFKILKKDTFVCYSPEKFITIENNKISSFPMKGTISEKTENAEQLLLNNPKEINEHYTIVDLIRNDLSIVSQDVKVDRFRYVEKIETQRGAILQTSSEISGILPEDWKRNIGNIVKELLPAGSVSGAPKKKSVAIIKECEGERRGYYTGVCGIFDGENLYGSVLIRYIEKIGEKFFYRSGGGITIHSDAKEEFDELIEKIYVPII